MSFDALPAGRLPAVPNFEFLIVTDGRKFSRVKSVPSDILHHLSVSVEGHERLNRGRKLVGLVDIPNADLVVVAARKQQAGLLRVPVEAVAFARVAKETQVRLHFVGLGLSAMLEVIEDVNFAWGSFSRDDLVRLRHVAGAVHFSLVIDLEFDLDALVFGLTESLRLGEGHLTGIGVVVVEARVVLAGIFRRLERNFDFQNLNVVLLIIRSVSAHKQALNRPVAIERTTKKYVNYQT
jgi:hypothetical protein